MINDFAYWLLEGGEPEVAKQLLEQIISITPERKAAWLNLADAQYETKEFPWDEQTVESYETYIRLMYAEGREKLIPDRVYKRIFTIKSNPEYKTNTN
jgi:Tfp pilus assembly protein PilF